MLHPLVVIAGALWMLAPPAPRQPPAPSAAPTAPAEASPAVTRPLDTAALLTNYRRESVAGFTVLVHRDMDADVVRARRVLAALRFDLEILAERVPGPALGVLHAVSILVTPSLEVRPGLSGRGMCFHASPEWLIGAGFERERAGTVEICNADDFLQWRAEQPMMALHEMAHAYHCAIGFDRPDVREAFARAGASGRYDRVRHALRDAAEPQRAYALTNEREYFAELSEAWFGRNDMEPMTRDQLREFDPPGAALIERLWGLTPADLAAARRSASPVPPPRLALPPGALP